MDPFNGTQKSAKFGSISGKSEIFPVSASPTEFNKLNSSTWCRHGQHEPLEGEDFFFNYSMNRLGCRSLLAMDY